MARIQLSSRGSFRKTEDFLKVMKRKDIYKSLESYGQRGVAALASATPVYEGIAASSWTYEVTRKGKYYSIAWHNMNIESGIPVVILIQYGHATRNGGYVQGRDFINPVIRPLFDQISDEVWKAVKNA